MGDHNYLYHPDGEAFDGLTLEPIERWKESELSGDEWRFSMRATLFFHGEPMGWVGGLTLADALLRASVAWRSRDQIQNYDHDKYRRIQAEKCCQPGCPNDWTVLLHPVKRYTKSGEELARPYRPEDVRGFCERHRDRGDCALDDTDSNYELVEERFPPKWGEEL